MGHEGATSLFYSLSDEAREGQAESEQKVLEICNTKLDMQISSSAIEHAQMISQYKPGKTRPVSVNFFSYNVKQNVCAWQWL